MKQIFCALSLVLGFLLGPPSSLLAEGNRSTEEKPADKISSEDRQVIKRMEMLELINLLEDMELLEGQIKAVLEEDK
ncbi:MAG: hypothetical protein R6V08_11100 [Desulfuromonadales bacterium]